MLKLHLVFGSGYPDFRSVRISALKALFNKSSVVSRYKEENNSLAHIAVADSHIAVCSVILGNLKVYDVNGEELFAIGRGRFQHPWGVLLLREGSVLVTDLNRGVIYKYGLEADTKQMWVC